MTAPIKMKSTSLLVFRFSISPSHEICVFRARIDRGPRRPAHLFETRLLRSSVKGAAPAANRVPLARVCYKSSKYAKPEPTQARFLHYDDAIDGSALYRCFSHRA